MDVLNDIFPKIFGALRARGYKPQDVFEAKITENARKMMDVNRAMELVKRIDKSVDRMFPATRGIFDKSTRQQKEQFFKDLDDLMFTGNIAERELNPEVLGRVSKMMKDKNLPKADRDQIILANHNFKSNSSKKMSK